jgi:hypothetical protein
MSRAVHGSLRGVVGAMTMSGLRNLMRDVGFMEEEPPRALVRQRFRGLLSKGPGRTRRATVELVHWSVGAGGGLVFALLPESLRGRPWAGPVYGVAIWLSFDAFIAPAFGVRLSRSRHVRQRIALAADHALYGLVLSELRERPRDAPPAPSPTRSEPGASAP